jgi:hypothetical protein
VLVSDGGYPHRENLQNGKSTARNENKCMSVDLETLARQWTGRLNWRRRNNAVGHTGAHSSSHRTPASTSIDKTPVRGYKMYPGGVGSSSSLLWCAMQMRKYFGLEKRARRSDARDAPAQVRCDSSHPHNIKQLKHPRAPNPTPVTFC